LGFVEALLSAMIAPEFDNVNKLKQN